jgi:ribosomal protein L37AE/L43A
MAAETYNLVVASQIQDFRDRLLQFSATTGPAARAKRRLSDATPGLLEARVDVAHRYLRHIDFLRYNLEHGGYGESNEDRDKLRRDLTLAQLMHMLVQGHGIMLVVDALTRRIKGSTNPMAGMCQKCGKQTVGHHEIMDGQWYCDTCNTVLTAVSPWENKQVDAFQRTTIAEQFEEFLYLGQFLPPLTGMLMDIGSAMGAFTTVNEQGQVVVDDQQRPVINPRKWITDDLMESLAFEVTETGGDQPKLNPDDVVFDDSVIRAAEALEKMPPER